MANDKQEAQFDFVDRYSVMGPPNGCKGRCEGTSVVPVHDGKSEDLRLVQLWRVAEIKNPAEDGWHFVPCPDCNLHSADIPKFMLTEKADD